MDRRPLGTCTVDILPIILDEYMNSRYHLYYIWWVRHSNIIMCQLDCKCHENARTYPLSHSNTLPPSRFQRFITNLIELAPASFLGTWMWIDVKHSIHSNRVTTQWYPNMIVSYNIWADETTPRSATWRDRMPAWKFSCMR